MGLVLLKKLDGNLFYSPFNSIEVCVNSVERLRGDGVKKAFLKTDLCPGFTTN